MKFNTLPLSSDLVKNLEENNFIECTEVQKQTIPHILEGKNLMIQAQTGTGKTAAFLIPLIEALLHKEVQNKRTGLIVAPTRELALQIVEDAEILTGDSINISGVALYGGMNIEKQERQLKQSQFIVATPGRLLDFCNRNKNLLNDIDYFVLDECDRLFDMGFYPDLKRIIKYLPPSTERTSVLCSATLSEKVRRLARESFHDTIEVDVSTTDLAVDKIKQEKIFLLQKEKLSMVLGLLQRMDASQSVLIFTNTKHSTESLALRLLYNGINCDYINGDLPQNRRQKVIQKLKEHKISVLIATDVAARGIHVHNLDLVINYDTPDDPQSYIHRIGRTGRAGKDGEAVSLVCDKFAYNLEPIEKMLGHKIPQMKEDYQTLLGEDASAKVPMKDLKKTGHKTSSSHQKERGRDRGENRNRSRSNYSDNRGGDRGENRSRSRSNYDNNRDDNRGENRNRSRSNYDNNRDDNRGENRSRSRSNYDNNRDDNRGENRSRSRSNYDNNRGNNRGGNRDENRSRSNYDNNRNDNRGENRDENRSRSNYSDNRGGDRGGNRDGDRKNAPHSNEKKSIESIAEKTLQKIEEHHNPTNTSTPTKQKKSIGNLFSKLLKKKPSEQSKKQQESKPQHTHTKPPYKQSEHQSRNRNDDSPRNTQRHSSHRKNQERSYSDSDTDENRNRNHSHSSQRKYNSNRNSSQNRNNPRNRNSNERRDSGNRNTRSQYNTRPQNNRHQKSDNTSDEE